MVTKTFAILMDNISLFHNVITRSTIKLLAESIDRANSEGQMQAPVILETAEWTKNKPNKPCVFMTRVWNNQLKIYDYNIWRLITTNGESLESPTYLGWYTEGGDEWDDYSTCNFDEYKIIGEV